MPMIITNAKKNSVDSAGKPALETIKRWYHNLKEENDHTKLNPYLSSM
jgi:hypothetical protein